jgi:uncharacterized FlaG/YvyC family protein
MEPIRPIDGITSDNNQTQAIVAAEIMRERFSTQRAQEMAPVEKSENNSAADNDRKDAAQESKVTAETSQSTSAVRRTYFEFEINRDTNEVLMRIFDADSGNLVRVIPPEDLAKELATGNLPMARMRRLTIHL